MKLLDWTKLLAAVVLPLALVSCKSGTGNGVDIGEGGTTGPETEGPGVENEVMPDDEKNLGRVESSRINARDGFIYQWDPIYFDYDSASIQSDSRETLEKIAQYLKSNSGKQVRVEGHCDERGTREYNRALAQRRASSAREYLIKLGASASSIGTISFGEEKPAETGHDDSAWAKNRRAEFGIAK